MNPEKGASQYPWAVPLPLPAPCALACPPWPGVQGGTGAH